MKIGLQIKGKVMAQAMTETRRALLQLEEDGKIHLRTNANERKLNTLLSGTKKPTVERKKTKTIDKKTNENAEIFFSCCCCHGGIVWMSNSSH